MTEPSREIQTHVREDLRITVHDGWLHSRGCFLAFGETRDGDDCVVTVREGRVHFWTIPDCLSRLPVIGDLTRIVRAQDQVLSAYRVGGRPPESALRTLERKEEVLAEAERVK